VIRPEGFALIPDGPLPSAALSALIRAIGGAVAPPASGPVQALAAHPGPATLAGVQVMPAGRFGPGWLLVREESAMAPPCEALPGVRWDGRFRLRGPTPAGLAIGALGAEAARFRKDSPLPSAILRTIPALRRASSLVAVPHIAYAGGELPEVVFDPPVPVACVPFVADRA
jgi:tRNA(Ile)-lysidine synthase